MTVVVVTGAAKGVGAALSHLLVGQDARVVGVDVDAPGLTLLRDELGPAFVALEGDVSDWATHERAADAATDAGGLGGWVNNAGRDLAGFAHDVGPEEIASAIEQLQLSAMYGTAVAVRRLLAAGGGAIVNLSSIQAFSAFPGYFAYQAAKAAIAMMSRGVAVDYAAHGIRCNVVAPGTIDTPMTRPGLTGAERAAALVEDGLLAPQQRVGTASEVAEVIAFLLSDRASYVNGVELAVDGGATARCFPYPPPVL